MVAHQEWWAGLKDSSGFFGNSREFKIILTNCGICYNILKNKRNIGPEGYKLQEI